jgi:hypothetical protein
MGLAKGLKRSGGDGGKSMNMQEYLADVSEGKTDSIGLKHHELIEGCPGFLRGAVHRFFVKENHAILKAFRLPWFIPERYGGLGLSPIYSRQSEIVKVYKGRYNRDASLHSARWEVEHYHDYMFDTPDFEGSTGSYAPSDLDLMMVRILSNHRMGKKYPIKNLGTKQPVVARGIWSRYCDFGVKRMKCIGDCNDLLKTLAESQEEVFPVVDLMSLFYNPSEALRGSEINLEALRRNERIWNGSLKSLALRFLKDEFSTFRPFKFVEDVRTIALASFN